MKKCVLDENGDFDNEDDIDDDNDEFDEEEKWHI